MGASASSKHLFRPVAYGCLSKSCIYASQPKVASKHSGGDCSSPGCGALPLVAVSFDDISILITKASKLGTRITSETMSEERPPLSVILSKKPLSYFYSE